ncbi:MAG: hypothetical protein NC299_04735 [Lachnospiraceae bacterium]|nr:hypothetical protein [Ruminococcus sp.]MCM1274655.1 hypothetical protein [Lachnospiraceae bacterium]
MKKFTAIICITAMLAALVGCSTENAPNGVSAPKSTSSYIFDDAESPSPQSAEPSIPDDGISEKDVETVKATYADEERSVFDARVVDLDFDGTEELLVLTHRANPKAFELWEKDGGKMTFKCFFGMGMLNHIDKIDLKEGKINGERAHLFSFAYDEGSNMKADEVLSAIKKTADGYEVEHLLSRGTISYPDIAEPFTKEFYRRGWNKGDIGMDADYGDISAEEYDKLYGEYTGNA